MTLKAWMVTLGVTIVGMGVLGRLWIGREVSPGQWRDGVSLTRWGVLWTLLLLGGIATAPALRGWRARVLAIVPLLVWIAWKLRGGSLAPIAFAIYAMPTVLAWLAGALLGDRVQSWHGRDSSAREHDHDVGSQRSLPHVKVEHPVKRGAQPVEKRPET